MLGKSVPGLQNKGYMIMIAQAWARVRQELQDHFNNLGPEHTPVDTFSLWRAIFDNTQLEPMPNMPEKGNSQAAAALPPERGSDVPHCPAAGAGKSLQGKGT